MKSSHLQQFSIHARALPNVEWRTAVSALSDWNELRLWRDPGGTAFIGVGSARVFDAPVFHHNVGDFREFAREITDRTVPAFVASAFEPGATTAREWSDFRRCEVVVPRATMAFDGEGARLFVCSRGSDAAAFGQSVEDAISSASQADASHEGAGPLDFEWDDASFEARVLAALDRIQSIDIIEKIVVARRLTVTASRPWRVSSMLETLRSRYPACFEFAIRRDDSTFLGATPERLVRVRDGKASTGALAGSARRGDSVDEDARLARALRDSRKDLGEHDVVIRMIVEKLGPISSTVEAAEAPELMTLSNVQHLYTPIEAQLHEDVDIGEVARRLHPTPAVGGLPRAEAASAISELEDFDRGLYAGFVGWIDSDGDGDLSVAIRSGILRGEQAHLYAGSGIVPDSKPADEAAETRAKLAAMLDALRGDCDA